MCVRFIINLPREELESVERICFQVEEAQWFYEDFVRPLDPNLPSLNLRQFCLKIFQHCPLFSVYDAELHSKAFSEFLAYKTRVPVRGAILLNDTLDEVVLVKGYKKGSSWSFPRGKINKDEKDIDCAIREVYEETGYDIRQAGLVGIEEDVRSIDITMREQNMKLFVFPGVPKDTHFEPRTRKEISKIEWYRLSDLPTLKKSKQQQQQQSGQELAKNANKFYMVAPFLVPLKKYIAQLRKRSGSTSQVNQQTNQGITHEIEINNVSAPVVDTNVLPNINDVTRLMAQLRQSQQASRENNFPEVSDPTVSAMDPSMQLKSLLQLPPTAPPAAKNEKDPAALRETKANAMLNLLRGAEPSRSVAPPPQTPYDQIIRQSIRPPASTKHHSSQPERTPSYVKSLVFPFPSLQTSNGVHRQPGLFPQAATGSAREINEKRDISPAQPMQLWHQQHSPHQPVINSHSRNGDRESLQDSQIAGDRRNIGPPASKLPLPKLNAHSSALLSLFKAAPPKEQRENAPIAQLPAENLEDPPELSTSRPTTVLQPQYAFNKPALSNVIGTTSALASSLPSHPAKSSPRSTSQHQENLLGLFKAPKFSGKASPSLVPPPAPVELAANQDPLQEHSSPSGGSTTIGDSTFATVTNSRAATKRLKGSLDLSKPNLSATVTGPLNVPQFESIQKPSGKRVQATPQSQVLQSGLKEFQQPIRILARPGSSHKSSPEDGMPPTIPSARKALQEPSHQHRTKVSPENSTKTFQPQILKRPARSPSPVDPIANQHSRPRQQPQTPAQPQKILPRPSNPEQPPHSRDTDQRATLLSLFGRSNTNLSANGQSSGFPVSPLTEKPGIDNGLVSPTGVGRSRIGSLQSLDDESLPEGGRRTPKMMASPQDKQFLLGFLDGVAREGRR